MTEREISELTTALQAVKVKHLLIMAKDFHIVGRHDMKKSQLINSIVQKHVEKEVREKEDYIEALRTNDVLLKKENQSISFDHDVENQLVESPKSEYIYNAQPGALVAFYVDSNKVMTAMVKHNDVDGQTFTVETKRGKRFVVMYSEILWVKSGSRWPRGIYNLLKGIKTNVKSI